MDINIILENLFKGITTDGVINLIVGMITFLFSLWTILTTKKHFREEKRISSKPYFNSKARLLNFDELAVYNMSNDYKDNFENIKLHHILNNKKLNKNGYRKESYKFYLELSNIGLGNAINCKITEIIGNIAIYRNPYFLGAIQKNESKSIGINFAYYMPKTYEEKLGGNFSKENSYLSNALNSKLKEKTSQYVYIDLEYNDVFDNTYKKTICILFFISFEIEYSEECYTVKGFKKHIKIIEEESIEELKKHKFRTLKKLKVKHKKSKVFRKSYNLIRSNFMYRRKISK